MGEEETLGSKSRVDCQDVDSILTDARDFRSELSPNQRAWRRFKRNRASLVSLWLLALLVIFVLGYPLFSPYRPEQVTDAQFQPPMGSHWLGTDVHGRDLLVRLCYGAQISLVVGVVGASVCLVIGVLWGAVAGLAGDVPMA